MLAARHQETVQGLPSFIAFSLSEQLQFVTPLYSFMLSCQQSTLSGAYNMLQSTHAQDLKTMPGNDEHGCCTFSARGRSRLDCGESQVGLPIAFRDDRVNGLEPGPHQRLVSDQRALRLASATPPHLNMRESANHCSRHHRCW
jgi:hypothetical protein